MAPRPKNLIFFLTDNHSRNVMGAAGHALAQTPNMDRIAASGMRFTQAYCVSPLCCPSRAALATGRYPHQTGYWDNALAYDGMTPSWHHRIRDGGGGPVVSVGKLHFRSGEDDNGFSDEVVPMHILEGRGALQALLRATPEGVPQRLGQREIYEESGVGEADYQIYDADITARAIRWLEENGRAGDRPWTLFISYTSPHPPFSVPEDVWDRFPLDQVPMPSQWRKEDRPRHPAIEYLAWANSQNVEYDEEFVRRVVAGYCALINVVDAEIGAVMAAAKRLGLLGDTRLLYTSDHGEAAGQHGILGKSNHYEHSIGVPLMVAGPGVPQGVTSDAIVSHVDLFPTLVESAGVELAAEDAGLPGRSLWPIIEGREDGAGRMAFAEFHAGGSATGSFALRQGQHKFVYHVDMPNQLFDLADDPLERRDLIETGEGENVARTMEADLRRIVDPEIADSQAKSAQLAHAERFGGLEAVKKVGAFSRSPIPGKAVEIEQNVG